MTDTLLLRDLQLWTRLGVPDEERLTPQRVLVSLSFACDAAKTAAADNLTDSTDYSRIREAVLALQGTERKTLERLAEDIASTVLRDFPVGSITVTVTKFPFPDAAGVSLTIERGQADSGSIF